MGKFLRVLTVFNLLFAIAAIVFAVNLFDRREILLGRADTFEIYLAKLARVLEAQNPEAPETPPDYEERDISEGTSELLAEPMRDSYWTEYRHELEETDVENTLDFGALRADIAHYYLLDELTGKPKLDEMSGARIADGSGTTQGALETFLQRAKAQHEVLQQTRDQLSSTRTQLLDTIQEVNRVKISLREKMGEKLTVEDEIRQQEVTIIALKNTIEGLESEINTPHGRVEELKNENRRKLKTIDELTISNAQLKAKFTELQGIKLRRQRRKLPDGGDAPPSVDSVDQVVEVESLGYQPGAKGTVAGVQEDHGFIVLRVNDVFAAEIDNQQRGASLPQIDLFVTRDDQFVAKVRIIKLEEGGLALAQILEGWQSQPIKRGDSVFHQ